MKKLKISQSLLTEGVFEIPSIPNTINFWHGGNLDSDFVAQKSGHYEYGVGLYAITDYTIAQKYSKGSRKLYLLVVEKGKDLNDSIIDFDKAKEFVNSYTKVNLRKELLARMEKYNKSNTIKASIFNTILINNKALKPSYTIELRDFLVEQGIDYEIVENAFGGYNKMLVLYNMKKLKKSIQVKPTDKIENYDLDK